MENIFNTYTDFITTDPRTDRPNNKYGSYEITSEFQFIRHNASLSPALIKDKKVVDLGSCLAATGAWCLHHGASKYVGIELQKEFCNQSKKNLEKYFPDANWEVRQQSLTDFFNTNTEKFDIIVAFGVIYQSIHVENTIKNICSLDCEHVVIESGHPRLFDIMFEQHNIHDKVLLNRMHKLPFIEYKNYGIVSETKNHKFLIESALPSLNALRILMMSFGYELNSNYTDTIKSQVPAEFEGRYSCSFTKCISKPAGIAPSFEESYVAEDPKLQTFSVGGTPNWTLGSWTFDKTIASVFVQHAEKHIPKYYEIIEQSAQLCDYFIEDKTEKIIDVGCATGTTLEVLHTQGFTNLVGVDNSQAMLDCVIQKDIANYILSDTLPADNYSAVICNWTLHFIKQKEEYIRNIYNNLKPNGILILTDKTKNAGVQLALYHQFKRKNGVSDEEIKQKAISLRGKMFINSEFWYIETCKNIGFSEVSIVNSAPCFTTFIMIK